MMLRLLFASSFIAGTVRYRTVSLASTLWVAQPSISMMLCGLPRALNKESKVG